VAQRQQDRPAGSYTTQLFDEGLRRIAQKVGEEGVEVALAAATGSEEDVCNESADLLYHLLVLLRARGLPFSRVIATLKERQQPR
jgi:phosphoribosyl-ATP pyrophosphohydrolase/phosphoribosyl-AMP cyclohydrolase